jgi:cytochrome oxidase Cu insertion factor (SCO1/SenC/PrrC family)
LIEKKRVLTLVASLCLCALTLGACTPGDLAGPTSSVPATSRPATTPNPTQQPTETVAPPPTATARSTAPAAGEQAPDFTLQSVWGEPITLSNYRGHNNVMLLFYRTGG